jgi:hypothetical protein
MFFLIRQHATIEPGPPRQVCHSGINITTVQKSRSGGKVPSFELEIFDPVKHDFVTIGPDRLKKAGMPP